MQLRQLVLRLAVATAQLVWISLTISLVAAPTPIALTFVIVYLLPFALALPAPGLCLACGLSIFATWEKLLWRHREVRCDVVRFYVLDIKQASLIYIYSIFSFAQVERCERVQRGLQFLHVSEFVVLVEYTALMIPVVYCFYLAVMSHLPSRFYYAQFKDLDSATLQHNISNVLLYALLELVPFLAPNALFGKHFSASLVYQRAFVLEHQWLMMQTKLVLWVVWTLQSPLEHYGPTTPFNSSGSARNPRLNKRCYGCIAFVREQQC